MPESQTPNVFGYNGEATDYQTGLQYLRARYYDAGIARFVQEDDYRGDFARPSSMNRYIYTENNPVMGIDPSGYYYTPSKLLIDGGKEDYWASEEYRNREIKSPEEYYQEKANQSMGSDDGYCNFYEDHFGNVEEEEEDEDLFGNGSLEQWLDMNEWEGLDALQNIEENNELNDDASIEDIINIIDEELQNELPQYISGTVEMTNLPVQTIERSEFQVEAIKFGIGVRNSVIGALLLNSIADEVFLINNTKHLTETAIISEKAGYYVTTLLGGATAGQVVSTILSTDHIKDGETKVYTITAEFDTNIDVLQKRLLEAEINTDPNTGEMTVNISGFTYQ